MREAGGNAEDDHVAFRGGRCQGRPDDFAKSVFVADGMVGREDGQQGIRLARRQGGANVFGGQGDGGGGVPPRGLQQKVAGGHPGQLLAEQGAVLRVRHHEDALPGKEARHPRVGELQQGLLAAGQGQELLGARTAAGGPEPGAVAAGHNDGVSRKTHGSLKA